MTGEMYERYVYEFVGGKADGKFLVVSHEVRQWKVPMVQLLHGFYDMLDMGPPSPPETHLYVATRPAAKLTIAPEIAVRPECDAWCIEQAKDAAAYGELRIAR